MNLRIWLPTKTVAKEEEEGTNVRVPLFKLNNNGEIGLTQTPVRLWPWITAGGNLDLEFPLSSSSCLCPGFVQVTTNGWLAFIGSFTAAFAHHPLIMWLRGTRRDAVNVVVVSAGDLIREWSFCAPKRNSQRESFGSHRWTRAEFVTRSEFIYWTENWRGHRISRWWSFSGLNALVDSETVF